MIYSAIEALKSTQHVWSITTVDDFYLHTDFHNPPYVEFLQNQCASHIQWFDDMPFQTWAEKNSFAKGPGGHPLEQAHWAAFEYMKKYYESLF